MDSYDIDYQTDRPERAFPLSRTDYQKLYIDAGNGALSFSPAAEESRASYEAEKGLVNFDITFEEDIEITGYMKLRLWVEADGNNDMDLFVAIQKLDNGGNWMPTHVLGEDHPGAWGKMRVSRRELDEKLSKHYQPVQAHRRDQFLKPGEIVPVEIEIWPHSRIWHKGEQLRVRVSGHYIREGWFEPFSWETNNKGNHVIHSGGQYDSYLQIPVIPPRLVAGDYVRR
jgi:predicted acyl esterase